MYSQKVNFNHCYEVELYNTTTTMIRLTHANILLTEDTAHPIIQLSLNLQLLDMDIDLIVELKQIFEKNSQVPIDFSFKLPLVPKQQSFKQISPNLYTKLLLVMNQVDYTM